MTIYDISLTISNTLPGWPGDPLLSLQRISDINRGDDATLSKLECSVHLGTHVDAPMHFLRGGAGIESLDLNVLIGPCHVIDLSGVDMITADTLQNAHIPPSTTRLLCRTRNSAWWAHGDHQFHTDFVAIDRAGAEWLVAQGVRLIGVDYLSVAPYQQSIPTHEVLLGAHVIPVEGLNLAGIEPGEYQLVCLPLKLYDCDGAPARAVLIRDD